MFRIEHETVTVGNTTTAVLAQNQKRRYLLLQNDSNEVIYVAFGKPAVLNEGIRLAASGGQFEMIGDSGIYGQAINGICTSGSKDLLVTYGT